MEFAILSAVVALIGFYFGVYKEKLTGLSILIVAIIISGFAFCKEKKAYDSSLTTKEFRIKSLEEIITSKEEVIKTIKGGTDKFRISPDYYYEGNNICYQFKFENSPIGSIYDLSIRYFPPLEISKTLRKDGSQTGETRRLYKVVELSNLSSNDWRWFGKPFSLKKEQILHYKFHVNTRNGMYWVTLIGKRGSNSEISYATKFLKKEVIKIDTITDKNKLKIIGTDLDTFYHKIEKFIPVDSFFFPSLDKFPVNIYDEKYNW